MKVIYRNGKIHTPQLELNVVEHCNLRCVECSHLSPYVSTGLLEPDSVRRDLAALAAVLHCSSFRFVGGEPLLHKRLVEIIQTVRKSGISDRVVVVSNGTLIDRMSDVFFQSIDELEISWYPQTATDADKIAFARSSCARYGSRLFVNDKAVFRKAQIDSAIESLKRTLQLDSTNFEAAFNLGVAYIQKRDLPSAADAFRASIKVNPNLARSHRALGETLLYMDQVDNAILELRRAVELAPQEPSGHQSLAKALAAKGLTAEADEEMRRAQEPQ